MVSVSNRIAQVKQPRGGDGANQKQLSELQDDYGRQKHLSVETEIPVRAFVPNFLSIKARQIEEWVNTQLDARSLLPVLLRRLIHSTGNEIHQIDFPGYDNAQRKGSDGIVAAGKATPWVPEGNSYWEFGTNLNPGSKAESDYAARLISIESSVRSNSTFVFVTPRNWNGKSDWEKKKNETGDWKSVRVFDASDLEQWLEQSVLAQIWLAEQLKLPVSGYETLDQAWSRWANGSEPSLTPKIFAPSLKAYKDNFKDWLSQPSFKPYVVAADSKDEALAFLACMFNELEFQGFKDITAVFTSPEELRKLISSSIDFIPIINSEVAERELLNAHQRLHCIVIRPRNAVDKEADIKLDLLNYETIEEALISMGIEEWKIERLAKESGYSPTILRRRLSQNAVIRIPVWAGDDDRAKSLIPLTLIGAWLTEAEADREIISKVANRNYELIEDDIVRLLRLDDSPVWSVGCYRGVVSKIDALFAIEKMVTWEDLDRFFVAAEYVLFESDPALELPEKDRWAAAIYNKTRNHSKELRKGICETLVILSVHGNNLFQSRIGMDVEGRIALLVRKLLTPLTLEKLLSQNNDLPLYAEAAPDEFIKIIEEDLGHKDPIVFSLLKPVDSSLFGVSPSRTGLLWALECLAWKPQNLPRVSPILARLSRLKIDDNWANKPNASLKAIFRSWMPQTAASEEQRFKVLVTLAKRFPDICWEISIEQIKSGTRIGHSSYRPNWRGDASGAGQVVTPMEMYEFNRKTLDLLISWPIHDERTLSDLVLSLQGMSEDDQTKVWNLIGEWSKISNDTAKAALRECIRQFAFTRGSRHKNLETATLGFAREAYNILTPRDPVIRHAWLFNDNWVQESVHEIEEDFDLIKHESRIDELRQGAMLEIWNERSFDGMSELIACSGAVGIIGRYITAFITDFVSRVNFILQCLSVDGDQRNKYEWCVQGFILAIDANIRGEILKAAANELLGEKKKRLFVCAPFKATTWRLLDEYDKNIRRGYWQEVIPSWCPHTPSERIELVDCLLAAGRPRTALYAVHMDFNNLETSHLKRLLFDVATVDTEPAGQFNLESYYVSQALSSLDGRVGVTREEMAQLEFIFIDVLDQSEHGIPNLEALIIESPSLFVQAITLAFKRRDEGADPIEWRLKNPEQQRIVALSAYRLLNNITKIPGEIKNDKICSIALGEWIAEVRNKCHELGRTEIGEQCIGQLLANSPVDATETWPCIEVCDVMEEISSPDIAKGFLMQVRNSRGVVWRGRGGEQERELAGKYRAWAERLCFDYPYVGSVLEDIAKSYDYEARCYDSDEDIMKRLRD